MMRHSMSTRLRALWVAAILWCGLVFAATPARATIRYEISLAKPGEHFLRITMTIPKVGQSVVVEMPAWNTLYQIRDFAYHVENFQAVDGSGKPLRVARLDKETWQINSSGSGDVRIEYATYWNEAGPFGTELNAQHAFLNLAMVLCYVPSRRADDTVVHFADVPAGWSIAAELPQASAAQAGEGNSYTGANYDALVDAPVEAGKFDVLTLQAGGRPIRIVVHGDAVDHARLTDMVSRIVNYETRLMGDAPFREYTFIFHVGRGYGGGGMEHANSTAIAVQSADQLPDVTAHEFFHLWNVKRIRSQALEPVDYEREMWTRSLWFAEGVTDTYATYTLVRTGLWTKTQYFGDLAAQITELESRPARAWQSAEESSLNAWFEKYSLYNDPEFSVSYYNKGQLLGVALDLVIRDATDNRASLDDVLRRLNEKYAHAGRFYPESEGIREAAEEVIRTAKPATNSAAGADLGAFFGDYVSGTKEIPFAELLSLAGLQLVERGQTRAGTPAYAVEEIPHPSERQMRILDGLLRGATPVAGLVAGGYRPE
jgi:predicted metalloprotease with PDZ domain